MAKYRKKPVVIEAFQYGHEEWPTWFVGAVADGAAFVGHGNCSITTLEGDMAALIGDYIIRGVQGEIYPCKPDIFEATYEALP